MKRQTPFKTAIIIIPVALLGVTTFFVMTPVSSYGDAGFTLVVEGAPPHSDVFVDNIRRGVTSDEGLIKVRYLKYGARIIRVSHYGFEDFSITVTGKSEEVVTVFPRTNAGNKTIMTSQW